MNGFLYPVPSQPPASGTQITRTFGDDWLAIILDRVDDLQRGDWFENAPDDIKQQVQELLDLLMTPVIIAPQAYPTTQLHFHKFSVTLVGNTIAYANVQTVQFNGYWSQSPAAQGDTFIFDIFLAQGAYAVYFGYQRHTTRGIISLYLDGSGSAFMTKDMYGTTLDNQEAGETLSINSPGLHTITGKVLTKNASSTGYSAPLNYFYFLKIG